MGGLRKREMAVCGVCKRKVWSQHLKRHLKQHSEDRAYVCNSCGLGFTHKCALKRHVITHTCKPLKLQRDHGSESILTEAVSVLKESIPTAVLQEGNIVNQETSGDACMAVPSQKSSEAILETVDPSKEQEKKDVECEVCRGRYPAEVFDQHLKQHARENKKFRCELCRVVFFQKNDLVSHRSRNDCSQVPFIVSYERKALNSSARSCEIKTVECEICHRYINKNMVKRHKQMHTEERPFKCESCGCGFNLKGNMTKHQRFKRCKLGPPIRVRQSNPVMGVVSREVSKVNEVIEKASVKKQRLATSRCSICHRLVHGHFMKRHLKQHAEDRKYKCVRCSLGFNHKQALNSHLAKNTCVISDRMESVERKCDNSESVHNVSLSYPSDKIDGGKYDSNAEVVKKRIQCQNCGTSFSNRSNLYRHLKNKKCGLSSIDEIHEEKNVGQLVGKSENKILPTKISSSNVCQYKESGNSILQSKNSSSGKVIVDDVDATKETCLICRKVYSSKRKLEEHMEEHLFRKMFRCVLCPKKYFSLAKCRKHMRSGHAQVSDSACRLCNKEIDNFVELEDHLFYHRWDKIYKCVLCNKVILKQTFLNSHLETHAGKYGESSSKHKTLESTKGALQGNINPGLHCCTICKLLFSSPSNLASHMKTHVAVGSSCNDNEGTLVNSIDDVTVFITDSNEEEDTERRLGHDLEGTTNGNNQNSDPLRDCEGDLSVFGDQGTQITNDECSSYARSGVLPNSESSTSVISTAVDQHGMNGTSSRMGSTEETFSEESVAFSECSTSSNYAVVGGEVSNVGGNKEDRIIEGSSEVFQNRVKEVTVYITESGAQETGFHDEIVNESEVRGSENSDPLTRDNVVDDSSYSGFTCIICNEQFLTRGSLEVHMSTHVEGRFHICNVCGESFSQKNYLRKHMAEHGENQKFRCSVCWVDFLFDSDLANHMNTHVTKAMNYDCIDCGRKFIKKSGLVRHSAVHSKNRLFRCDLCQLTFVSKDSLHRHLKNHTQNEQEIGVSAGEGSQMVFDRDAESRERVGNLSPLYDDGKLEAKENDGAKMNCPFCGKVCKTRGSYTLHLKIHSANRKYKCEFCDRKYGSKLKLRKHMKKYNHKHELQLFQRLSAKGEFTSDEGELDNGERTETHTSEIVDESAADGNHICESTFTKKVKLDAHYRDNSFSNNLKNGCKEPDMSSGMETSELWNNSEIVGDPTVGELREQNNSVVCSETEDCDSFRLKSEKFVCGICGMRCKKKSSLALHVKYHKPFESCKCSLCDLTFPDLIKLRQHEREHRNIEKIESLSSADEQSSILDEGERDMNGEDEVMYDNTLEGDQNMQIDLSWSFTLKEKPSEMLSDNTVSERDPSSYSRQKMESHGPSGIESERYQCGVCGKQCKTINSLILHQKMHLSHKGYDCSFCRLTFTSRLKYLKHQSVHEQSKSGDEVFDMEAKLSSVTDKEKEKCNVEDVKESCGVNGYSFHSKNEKCTESDVASEEYNCRFCSLTFSSEIKLQDHACKYKRYENDKGEANREGKPPPLVIRNNVNEILKESEDHRIVADARDVSDLELLTGTVDRSGGGGRYVCPTCGKKCSRNNSLVLHQKVHSYFKRYTCRMCSLVFTNKVKLYKHQKIHRLKNTMEMDNTEVGSPNVSEEVSDDSGFNGERFKEGCRIEDVRGSPEVLNNVSLDDEISRSSEKSLSESVEYTCNICLNKCLGKSAFIHHLQMNHGDFQLGLDEAVDKFGTVEKNSFTEETPDSDEIYGLNSNFASDSMYTGSLAENERLLGQPQTNLKSSISQRKICYCIICKIEFKRPSGFARHMKIHGSVRYECNVCLRVFSSKGKLKKHKKCHLQRKFLSRSISEKSSRFIEQEKPNDMPTFNEHLDMGSGVGDEVVKETVPGEKSNVCSICGMEFQKSCGLASHMRTHSMARPYSCNFCGRRFNSLVTMEMHKSRSHKKKSSVGKLKKPTIKVDQEKPLERHNEDVDDLASFNDSKGSEVKTGSSLYHPCTFCGLTFQRPCSLGSHLRVHLNSRSYCCSLCSRTFKSSVVLEKHERLCHRKKVAVKSNDEGEVSFKEQKETENTNNKSETSTKSGALVEGQYNDLVNLSDLSCNMCGLQFRKACGLQSHVRTHLNNRPYYCNLCDSTFTTAYTLKSHEKHRHKKEQEELSVKDGGIKRDDYSGPDVDDLSSMSSHIYSPKERKNLHLDKKVHACEICGTKFSKSCDLAVHLKVHSDGISKKEIEPSKKSSEDQYKCHICTGKFSDDESFRLHLRSHEEEDEILEEEGENSAFLSNEKKHSCKICGKKFRHSGNYKVHIWSHEYKNAMGKKDKNIPKEPTSKAEGELEQSTEQSKLFDYMGMKRTKSGHMKVECKLCGKLMAHRGNFVTHMRGHRDKGEVEALGKTELDDVKDKADVNGKADDVGHPIRCSKCNKNFKSKWALDRHVHVHSKITIGDSYSSHSNGCDLTTQEHDPSPSNNADSHIVDNSVTSDFNLASSSRDSIDYTKWEGETSTLSRDSNISPEKAVGPSQEYHKIKLESRTCKYCCKVFKYRSICVYHMAKHSEKDYKCAFCSRRYYYKKEFLIHTQSHENVLDSDSQGRGKVTKQEISSDGNSQTKWENNTGMQNIVTKAQERDINLSCRMCGKYLPTHKSFRKHQRIHSQQTKNRCGICVKKYKSRSSYRKHMRIHHPELEGKCSYCGFKCDGSCQYKLQETDKVDINESNENEGLGSEASATPPAPLRGLRTKGDRGISHGLKAEEGSKVSMKKRKICEVLPSSSGIESPGSTNDINDENLKDYVAANTIVDNSKAKPFICSICGKGFRYMKYIKLHMEVHLEQRFKCEICHKGARSAQRLKRHMTVHQLGKRFRCEDCGSAFTQMSSLKKHCHIFHRNKIENIDSPELEKRIESKSSENVKSDVCTEKLPSQEFCDSEEGVAETPKVCENINLEGNEDDSTLDNRSLFGKSNFVCHICGKVALSGSHLDSHMIRHSQEKPFKCPLCQKFFKRDYTVRKHIREIHNANPNQFHPKSLTSSGRDITVDLPYKCSICDKGFIYDTSLKAHTMFHMRESSMFSGECEEEVYECAVETNEDDGILSIESVRLEDTNKYLKEEKEYFVEDMAIDIKEELVDDIEEDYEDLMPEEFLLNDFDLMEQNAPEHLNFTGEIDSVSESIDFSNFSESCIFGDESGNTENYSAFSSEKEQGNLYIPENIEASCSSKC
ncbi:uncharacterized protein [Palaemon carinicauda]|uniref:uncharacterized protein isoform X2 n=1 Tax=Palaemon carinicauda TaxID=392227 RepID=UPI0035B5D850